LVAAMIQRVGFRTSYRLGVKRFDLVSRHLISKPHSPFFSEKKRGEKGGEGRRKTSHAIKVKNKPTGTHVERYNSGVDGKAGRTRSVSQEGPTWCKRKSQGGKRVRNEGR